MITDVSENNLIKKLPEFDACTLRVSKLNENILKHCSKLKVISRHGVGYDNVDLDYIKKKNISLLITATANAVAVAEHVIYMMMSISKSINQYDNEVRSGNFKKNSSIIETFELFDKEILILGSTGSIGKSTLQVISANRKDFKIKLLTTNNNVSLIYSQAIKFDVKIVIINNKLKFKKYKKKFQKKNIKVLFNFKNLNKIFKKKVYYTINGISGINGLEPTINIIPHTLNLTNLKTLKKNDIVNVELDIFGKYMYKYKN